MSGDNQIKLLEDTNIDIVEDYFNICYKLVSSTEVKYANKQDTNIGINKKKSILGVLTSFNTSKPINIKKLNMKENTKIFIKKIFEDHNEEYVHMLLNDFSEDMNTKMREEDKYAVLILLKERLILAHTKIGETSINTDFNVFERLLDKDNVMRIVFFDKTDDGIFVHHYEKNKSKFFINWLGIPKEKLFYSFGGGNKFYSEIYGCSIVLEITDEDLNNIEYNKFFKIQDNSIQFNEKITNLKINHIMRQNKKFNCFEKFEIDYLSRKYDLKYYKDKYTEINESLNPFLTNIYDDEFEVTYDNEIVEKKNKNISLLFCNEYIHITKNYLEKIISSILNNESINLTHIGEEFSQKPIEIGNLKIYNSLKLNLSKPLINYFNEYNDINNNFKKELIYVIFSSIKYDNPKSVFVFFIDNFLDSFKNKLNFYGILNENEIIELKSKDFFSGNNKNIVEKISEDITKKLKQNEYKLYVIGYNEKNKKYDPISSQPFNDDRIHDLKKQIIKQTDISDLNLIKVPINEFNCIIYCSVKK